MKKNVSNVKKLVNKNRKIVTFVTIIVMLVFVIFLSNSFGYFSKRIEGGKLTFNVGTLSYELECVDLTNCEVTIPANESKVIEVNLTSLNNIDTKYELYYEIVSPEELTNIVDGGHLSTEELTTIGNILENETKKISLVINNTGSDEVTLKLGALPSLKSDKAILEDEQVSLNKFAYQKFYVYDYTGNDEDYQTFVAPTDGVYQIELWGAGFTDHNRGGYVKGKIQLINREKLYVYVGQQGYGCNPYTLCDGLAYNGGGAGDYFNASNSKLRNTGGSGATDIRLESGLWNDEKSLKSRIMVAGGAGRGVVGNSSAGGLTGYMSTDYNNGGGGTQIAGGTSSYQTGGFGYGGNGYITYKTSPNRNDAFGGGSGYYGGGGGQGGPASSTANRIGAGGGGSSYISGHTGCIAITSEDDQTPKVETYSKIEDSYHYSGKVFADTVMIDGRGYEWTDTSAGELVNMPTHDLTSTMVGNNGNGYARITLIEDTYTIVYNANGGEGTMDNSDVPENGSFILKKNSYTKDGYGFVGWSLSPDSDEVIYEDMATVSSLAKKGEVVTLYAVWLDEFTITFDATGGTVSPSTKKVPYGSTYGELPIPIRSGYTFDGWFTESSGGTQVTEEDNVITQETLYAHWTMMEFSQTYAYKEENYQVFQAPYDGYYKLEAWGAQGGNYGSSAGGKGAYTSGEVYLEENTELYVYVGSQPSSRIGGYNGGGYGGTSSDGTYRGGGGATDFRLVDGEWNDAASLASRIMVAAGGAGTGYYYETVIYGGNAGALTGYSGTSRNGTHTVAKGGTQTSGGLGINSSTAAQGEFGYASLGSRNYGTGGGSGYYGGGGGNASLDNASAGAGGSSYVSGYTGCVAITSESDITPKTGCTDGTTDISCSYHYSGKIFNNPTMKSGNAAQPAKTGTSTQTGNTGNGQARITYLGNDI